MEIINRSPHRVYWAVFDKDDIAAATDFGIPRQRNGQGQLEPGEKTGANGSGSVQLRIRTTLEATIKLPGAASLPPTFIRASRDKIYQETDQVVFTAGGQLVALNDRFREYVGLLNAVPTATRPPTGVDVGKVVRGVMAVAEALISNAAWGKQADIAKWTTGGVFKLAFALADIFGSATPAKDPLAIKDVEQSVQRLIDENEARLAVPQILDTIVWLNKYIAKSRALSQSGVDMKTVDLSDYDRQQFIDELNKHVDGNTPFRGTMATLRGNRAIRKHAMPTYLLGAFLHLHLEMLSLCVKRASTPLDVADVQSVVDLTEAYRSTLDQMKDDFAGLCLGWLKEFPLLFNPESISNLDLSTIYPDPQPEEGLMLARAAVIKWLQGDRTIIAQSGEKLTAFVGALQGMHVGV